MASLEVDLRFLEVDAPAAARASGVNEDRICGGALRLWKACWATKRDTVSRMDIMGAFGPDRIEDLIAALEMALLEKLEADRWRVRGAARYLRVMAGRSAGGHAAKSNLIPGARQKKSSGHLSASSETPSASLGSSREPAESQPRTSPEPLSAPLSASLGSTPSTVHRSPKKTSAPASQTPRDSDLLAADFKAIVGTDYLFQGAKDGVALAELRKASSIEQIRERWRAGLQASADDWASCRTIAQLKAKWNDLANAKPAEKVSIEHQPSRML